MSKRELIVQELDRLSERDLDRLFTGDSGIVAHGAHELFEGQEPADRGQAVGGAAEESAATSGGLEKRLNSNLTNCD